MVSSNRWIRLVAEIVVCRYQRVGRIVIRRHGRQDGGLRLRLQPALRATGCFGRLPRPLDISSGHADHWRGSVTREAVLRSGVGATSTVSDRAVLGRARAVLQGDHKGRPYNDRADVGAPLVGARLFRWLLSPARPPGYFAWGCFRYFGCEPGTGLRLTAGMRSGGCELQNR